MKSKFILNLSDGFTTDAVGLKAKSLSDFRLITPEFKVLSSSFFEGWKKGGARFLGRNNSTISELSAYFQKKHFKQIIIRSSSTKEDLEDRGKYLSEVCDPSVRAIKKCITKIFTDFKQNSSDCSLALIFQEYKKPKIQGHLSNERRVDSKNTTWLVEHEFSNQHNTSVERIEVNIRSGEFDNSINKCFNTKNLKKSIESVASWFSGKNERVHIEWVWDGAGFWIVQVDTEKSNPKGSKPADDWYSKVKESKKTYQEVTDDFLVLETASTANTDWPKIKCLKELATCALPFWQIYVLENPKILEELSTGSVDKSLTQDLKKLLVNPIIIRTDTNKSSSKFEKLLPRTDTVYEYNQAIDFLLKTAKSFKSKGFKANEFSFLIHHFIPSTSGALCYADPKADRVRIDSTWGIVEGLYFHPHDSFEVRLSDRKISRKLRCKSRYVDFDKNGNWYSKDAGSNFDWKASLTDNQIRTIADYSQKLSQHLGTPVTIMFFVNDKRYYPEILPWIYSDDEIPDKDTSFTKVIFSEKRVVITSKEDFKKLEADGTGGNKKIKLLIKLNSNLYRDKKFIEEIAKYSKQRKLVIDIEGSILSHPYYVFHSQGVHVRCVDPFEPTYTPQEFHKLVRDRIPVLIESHKEQALVTRVESSELLHYLKEKAVEEAFELYWSKNNDLVIEEMADLFEVILGACKAYGIDFEEIKEVAKKKRDKRGGFENGVVLVATKENSLFQLVDDKKNLFGKPSVSEDVKLRQTIKFHKKGEIDNLKSLKEVDEIHVPYINNYATKSNKYRYLLKKDEYNSVSIEYREKEIVVKFERKDLEISDSQLMIWDKGSD